MKPHGHEPKVDDVVDLHLPGTAEPIAATVTEVNSHRSVNVTYDGLGGSLRVQYMQERDTAPTDAPYCTAKTEELEKKAAKKK